MDQRLVSPVLMWGIIAVGAALAVYVLPSSYVYEPGPIHRSVFAITLVYWVAMFSSSLYHHREAARSARGISRLVTSGPYAVVRHPIYSADMTLAWGLVVGFPKLSIIASAAWLTAVMLRWVFLEEAAMGRRFGGEYAEYRKKTPILVPRLLGRR